MGGGGGRGRGEVSERENERERGGSEKQTDRLIDRQSVRQTGR